ncbi:MAG: hypothetical protein WDO73_24265 [Ignavibacteriota bacterium]
MTGPRRVIECDGEVGQRLPRNVRESGAIERLQGGGNVPARRLQVALHAYLGAPLRAEFGGIDDGGATAAPHVFATRTVTALAIDALGQFAEEDRIAAGNPIRRGDLRVSIVAEHAFIGHESASLWMCIIGPWDHRPFATLVWIPAEW